MNFKIHVLFCEILKWHMSEEIIMLAKIVITSFLSNIKTLDIHSLITVKNLHSMQETWV